MVDEPALHTVDYIERIVYLNNWPLGGGRVTLKVQDSVMNVESVSPSFNGLFRAARA